MFLAYGALTLTWKSISGAPQPRLRTGEAIAQALEVFAGGGDVAASASFLTQSEQSTPDPDERPRFSGWQGRPINQST